MFLELNINIRLETTFYYNQLEVKIKKICYEDKYKFVIFHVGGNDAKSIANNGRLWPTDKHSKGDLPKSKDKFGHK